MKCMGFQHEIAHTVTSHLVSLLIASTVFKYWARATLVLESFFNVAQKLMTTLMFIFYQELLVCFIFIILFHL